MMSLSSFAQALSEFCIRHRKPVTALIVVSTIAMAALLMRLEVYTEFSDMVPQGHPYVDVHEEYKRRPFGAPTRSRSWSPPRKAASSAGPS